MVKIFPAQDILDGIFRGAFKTYVWRDINLLHKLNQTFIPSRSDRNEIILQGKINIQKQSVTVQITLPPNYLQANGSINSTNPPIFQIIEVPPNFQINSTLFTNRVLKISEFLPSFATEPLISTLVGKFTTYFQDHPLLRNGKDIIDQLTPEIDRINRELNNANKKREATELKNNLAEIAKDLHTSLQSYSNHLEFIRNQYQDSLTQQHFSFSADYEQRISLYANRKKYEESRSYLEGLYNNNIISAEDYIEAVKAVSHKEFREQIFPSLSSS